ncbi:MAG: diaminopimelate decarboxylase [Proteobacteria bacterium]|nr:MAG: diaminopimelate decarboxylase [Pseudomonadota bacterium]
MAAVAEAYGTPCYLYSRSIIEANYRAYAAAFGQRRYQICYAVKANGNLAVLDVLARLGSAFDIVSAGELERVRAAGGDLSSITFAGVGKTRAELELALTAQISCFNVESTDELELLAELATDLGVVASIAVRVNPDVDAQTHAYIATGMNENKFGIPMAHAMDVYRRAARMPSLRIAGVACHIGSQLTSIGPIVDAAEKLMQLVDALTKEGMLIEHIDIGGGLGIAYGTEAPPAIDSYVKAICGALDPSYEIIIEPGRSIVGAAGVLLTRIQTIKHTPVKTFAICDAAMTELIRPALYQAYHEVLPVNTGGDKRTVDVVGPVCESGDFLARERELAVASGDLLALMDCGAYGFVMASNYNARPRPAEIMVDGEEMHLVRERETLIDLYAGEYRLNSD